MDAKTLAVIVTSVAGVATAAFQGGRQGGAELTSRVDRIETRLEIVICKVSPENCQITGGLPTLAPLVSGAR